jgi:hypothetical protein
MADVSRRTSPWVTFLAAGVAVLAVILLIVGWRHGQEAVQSIHLGLRDAPALPSLPHLPDAPRLPDAPVPTPK